VSAADSLREVVANGLCIGCGLCEAMAGPDRVRMTMTAEGRLRPVLSKLPAELEARILDICPGAHAEAVADPEATIDPIWGGLRDVTMAWAGDPEIRYRAATGGVLTGLASHLLESGEAAFVLHVKPDPDAPVRSVWTLSETRDDLLDGTASRYGPAAPLAGLEVALAREQPFALVAKPCDIAAVRRLAKRDPRVDRYCAAMLTLICGGASELTKSLDVLGEEGIAEAEVSLFRYRGYGNPGPTRIETRDGRAIERSYQEMWGDAAGWKLQGRCRICPDAIGEAADIVSGDAWPGAEPEGEDEGFNVVLARTGRGEALLDAAVASGALVRGEPAGPRDLDGWQPHQVRKKRAAGARFATMRALGRPDIETEGLRLADLAAGQPLPDLLREARGMAGRLRRGRFDEPVPED